jgi:hypothetical protein
MSESQKPRPDTEDKGHGYWKDGKWCQSAATKKANRAGRAIRQSFYARHTGREAVCDE